MVHSTTSSHWSVFRQRIPEYELKQVRHWVQFKNRLDGMELCLENLDRNIWMKEVQVSECFAKETMVLSRLMGEFAKNSTVMDLVAKYFDLRAEWDGDIVRRLQLRKIQKEKTSELNNLLDEYNSLPNS